MAETYKAVFTCPTYDEREVWYVSSKSAAELMLSRQIRNPGGGGIQAKYKNVEYEMTIEPVFVADGFSGYDPRGIG